MIDTLPPVLHTEEMREADRTTIDEVGIPGFTLMELAGRALADEAAVMVSGLDAAHITILCGKGNNGGDGFVAARILQQMGMTVDVCHFCEPEQLAGDASRHFQILLKIKNEEEGLRFVHCTSVDDLSGQEKADLYIDALLGIGLSSEVREPLFGAINWINDQKTPVLAADLPSGIQSDDGTVLGVAVRADVTVTMGALKAGLLVNDGPDYSGSIVVADIGIPQHVISRGVDDSGSTYLCQSNVVGRLIPRRSRDAHKYATGPTIVVGGSLEFPGAPVLAATAAARIGSGYVVAVGSAEIVESLSEKLTEIPVASIGRDASGWLMDALTEELGTRWQKAKSLLIGPGLGSGPEAKALVMKFLERVPVPAVVDADALNALRDERDFVRTHSNGRWIFTPHAGEFARMTTEANTSPIRAARAFASDWNVIVLLKGMPSVTAAPDGTVVVNDTGNPAVATAGTGDVLAGMVAGLVAQGMEPFHAAICGIHIGGSIADRYAATRAAQSMMASDVLTMIPEYLGNHS